MPSYGVKIEDRTEYFRDPAQSELINTLRVYPVRPGSIAIQTRTYAPLTTYGRKPHFMLSHAELTRDEARELASALNAFLAE
jgi:hypothetical protein